MVRGLVHGSGKGFVWNAREVGTFLPSDDVDHGNDCRGFSRGNVFIDDASTDSQPSPYHGSVHIVIDGLTSIKGRFQGCWRCWSASVPFDLIHPELSEVDSERAFYI